VQSNRPVTLSHDTVTTRYLAEHHDSNRFLLVPQEIVVSKVLNILENRKAKLSQSQVYRPISLNLLHHHWQKLVHTITWIVRRLSCTSQPGLFTSMLSYWKILCPGLTWFVRNLILIPCHSFLWSWFFFPSGLTVLQVGIDYFSVTQRTFTQGFDRDAWLSEWMQWAKDAFPMCVKEVRLLLGTFMVKYH
jgi:hypothetical protein